MSSYLPPAYHFKIRRWNPVDRLAWLAIRAYLNRGRYQIRIVWSGPRDHRNQVTTPKANRTGWRVYVEPRRALEELEEDAREGRRVRFAKRHQTRLAARAA